VKEKLKHFIDNFEGYLCVVMLIAMSIIVFLQVIFRFILKSSLPWSEEVSRYLLVWITFMGGAYGVKTGAHLGVEAVQLLLPVKARKVAKLITHLVGLIVCVVVLIISIGIIQKQLAGGQKSPALRLEIGYIYLAIPVGMVFFIIRYLELLVTGIRDFNKDLPAEDEASAKPIAAKNK
jgi:C4-dicarboxylate transporter DctQ subunit